MTKTKWLARANSPSTSNKITSFNEAALEDFQSITDFVQNIKTLDWPHIIVVAHMVYGWMPTMLKSFKATRADRLKVLESLQKVKDRDKVSMDQLEEISKFTNNSFIGVSKLLHVINPQDYPIWDSRVASAFLWPKVSHQTLNTKIRYEEYLTALREWREDCDVKKQCQRIRTVHRRLKSASDMRIIEFVLYQK